MFGIKREKNKREINLQANEGATLGESLLSEKSTQVLKQISEKISIKNGVIMEETEAEEEEYYFPDASTYEGKIQKIAPSKSLEKKSKEHSLILEESLNKEEPIIEIIEQPQEKNEYSIIEKEKENEAESCKEKKNEKIIVEKKNNNSSPKENSQLGIRLRIVLIFKIVFGCFLIDVSILLIYLTYLDENSFSETKIFTPIFEPIILLITFLGIYPKKSSRYRKIVLALYIWAAFFLTPFTFLSKSNIKNIRLLIICEKILIVRISLLLAQLLLLFIVIIFKLPV